jgi:iron complex transport system ATP-binding protein
MTLRLDHISFAYPHPGQRVVDGVSVEARPGRITTIIGPNAVGKSTLLRLMAGVLAADEGHVLLGNRDLHELTASERAARIAYVPQRPRVDAPFTIREVVELGRFALTPSPQAVTKALAQCDLAAEGDRIFNSLSVGQQQRAALARALAQVHGRGDAVLLLDEPTSALDPRHVQQTARALRASADAGMTVVVILHDLILAGKLSDDTWIMHEGSVIAAGPTAEVCEPALLEKVYGVEFRIADNVLVADGS